MKISLMVTLSFLVGACCDNRSPCIGDPVAVIEITDYDIVVAEKTESDLIVFKIEETSVEVSPGLGPHFINPVVAEKSWIMFDVAITHGSIGIPENTNLIPSISEDKDMMDAILGVERDFGLDVRFLIFKRSEFEMPSIPKTFQYHIELSDGTFFEGSLDVNGRVDVVNPSFETSDPFTVFSVGGDFNNTINGWETTQATGTFRPSTPSNSFGFDVFTQDVPDGRNTAFALGNGIISQKLTIALGQNTTYKLEVEVGNRSFMSLPDSHSVELRAGGIVLASGKVAPANGTFTTLFIEYNTKEGDPFGEPLEVWLMTSHSSSDPDTVQINWDNVRVTAIAN